MKKFIGRFVEFYRPFWKVAGILILFTLFSQALNFVSPYMYGKIVDALFKNKPAKEIVILSLMSLGFYFFQSTLIDRFFYWFEINRFKMDVHCHISQKTLQKVMDFSVGQDTNENSGVKQDVIKRGEHSMSVIANLMLQDIFPLVMQTCLFAVALMYINWTLGLVVLCGISAHVAANIYINYKFKDDVKELNDKEQSNNKIHSEILRNIEVVKYNAQEKKVLNEFWEDSQKVAKLSKRMWSSYSSWATSREMIIGITRFAVVAVGALHVYKGFYSPGYLVIFLAWSERALGRISSLGGIQRMLMSSYASVKKYFAMMDIEPDIKIVSNPVRKDDFKGKIEFKNVSFEYPHRNYIEEEGEVISKKINIPKEEVLDSVSFTIEPGQKVALVGRSGSGKSTIVRLLLRAYDPCRGQIVVDGDDLRVWDLDFYRNLVGLVEQDVSLFDNTLRYNITFSLNGRGAYVTNDDLMRVAELSRLNEFYSQLEFGFDTVIGEKGIKLSGGQRQRVGIARALIKNPKILIFDEATSNLDAHNDAMIHSAVKEISQNRTTVIIAHRLSTIKDADSIIVVDSGNVVGQGKHHELMMNCEQYKNLVHSQVHVF